MRATATPADTPSPTSTASATATVTETPISCVGDCNADGRVTVEEIILGVNIALGSSTSAVCPAMDRNHDAEVRISELIDAVGNALDGCRSAFR
ncbi:MAG: hypothetical protein ABI629_17165 [bacterium]